MNRLLLAFLFVATAAESQSTIRVPADQATIQAAILAASNGDTVLVSPGSYKENINFAKKAITEKSSSGPDVTIIDGIHLAPVVPFGQGEDHAPVIQPFTTHTRTFTPLARV